MNNKLKSLKPFLVAISLFLTSHVAITSAAETPLIMWTSQLNPQTHICTVTFENSSPKTIVAMDFQVTGVGLGGVVDYASDAVDALQDSPVAAEARGNGLVKPSQTVTRDIQVNPSAADCSSVSAAAVIFDDRSADGDEVVIEQLFAFRKDRAKEYKSAAVALLSAGASELDTLESNIHNKIDASRSTPALTSALSFIRAYRVERSHNPTYDVRSKVDQLAARNQARANFLKAQSERKAQ